ncbi:MAG: hypothetical protein JWL84_4283 [Rhodospirillales bacterium]|jgi:hypothetical protein|nr:hypothetical protein [Rhodospirillales bacterium]
MHPHVVSELSVEELLQRKVARKQLMQVAGIVPSDNPSSPAAFDRAA